MKNFILSVASIPLLLVLPSVALSAEAHTTAVDYVLEQQILFPEMDGNFNGAGVLTRLEFVLAVVDHVYPNEDAAHCLEQIGSNRDASYSLVFDDVKREEWYAARLCVAMRAGLIQGNRDGSFRPFDVITKAEASKIIARAYGLPQIPLTADEVWYARSMQSLSMYGGIGSSTKPEDLVNRSSAATMFYSLRGMEQDLLEPATTMVEPRRTEDMTTSSPSSSAPSTQTTVGRPQTPVTTQIISPGRVSTMVRNGCRIWDVRSPGMALLLLGQSAHPTSIDRSSHRVLRDQVEYAYENGILDSNTQTAESVFGDCGGYPARSPGAGLLQQNIIINRTITERVPSRFVRAAAENREHIGGVNP